MNAIFKNTITVITMTLMIIVFINPQTGTAQSKKQIKAELEQARLEKKEAQEALISELQRQKAEAEQKAKAAESEVQTLRGSVIILSNENDMLKKVEVPKKVAELMPVKSDTLQMKIGEKIRTIKISNGNMSILGTLQGVRLLQVNGKFLIEVVDVKTSNGVGTFSIESNGKTKVLSGVCPTGTRQLALDFQREFNSYEKELRKKDKVSLVELSKWKDTLKL